jgi:hypothetical protein
MAALLLFWSLAALMTFVTAWVWRPATGNLLSATRRRVFSALLGAATGGLSLLAYEAPPPFADLRFALALPRRDLGAETLASAVGIAFALAVDRQLARLARPELPRGIVASFLVAFPLLAALLPPTVLLARPRPPLPPLVPVAVGPTLPMVIESMDGASCGVGVTLLPDTRAHRACAPTPGLHLERQWVIATALTAPEATPAYLVRVCAHEDDGTWQTRCTYSLEHAVPSDDDVDVRPYSSGTPVDPAELLEVRFEPRHRLWMIDATTTRAFYDAWTLGPATGSVTTPDVERRLVLVPPRWTAPLALWAIGAALALWTLRAAQRRDAVLARARRAEIRDGLLHVEGEEAPRRIVQSAGDAEGPALHGPALWTPTRREDEALVYRAHPLAVTDEIALGDRDGLRHAARGEMLRAFALLASVVGCGPLPVLVAAVGHALLPAVEVHFGEHRGKAFVDTSHACADGEVLVDGGYRRMPTPPDLLRERLPPSFCVDASSVTVDAYGLCEESGVCAASTNPADDDLGPESAVRVASAGDAEVYCAWRGKTVATPAQVLAGLDARDGSPQLVGTCVDFCPRSEHIAEASNLDRFRCARQPQVFAIDVQRRD